MSTGSHVSRNTSNEDGICCADAYETGKATLEFLSRRRAKLGHDLDPVSNSCRQLCQGSPAILVPAL